MMKGRKHRGLAGFSVTEALLAMAMVAAVWVLLLPVFSRAREGALSTRCVANLRQTGGALLAYAAEYRGYLPPRVQENPDRPGTYLSGTYWHQVLREKGYMARYGDESTNAGRVAAQKAGAHFCPSLPSNGGAEEAYGMRRWRTPGEAMDVTQNLTVLENRADFFLLADSYKPQTGTQGYSLTPGASAYRIALRHGGLANTLFADGHVAAQDRTYFAGIPARQKTYQNGLPYTFWPETP